MVGLTLVLWGAAGFMGSLAAKNFAEADKIKKSVKAEQERAWNIICLLCSLKTDCFLRNSLLLKAIKNLTLFFHHLWLIIMPVSLQTD